MVDANALTPHWRLPSGGSRSHSGKNINLQLFALDIRNRKAHPESVPFPFRRPVAMGRNKKSL